MAASSDIPMQIAETIQTAHINRAPSAAHDLNPSTAADTREPVRVVDDKKRRSAAGEGLDDEEDDDDDDIPVGVLRPQRRFAHLPPIPDLRFEQSYLHSIRDSKTWWMVAWVTARDQVMMPLVQGVVYNLVLCGWQHWNQNAKLSGNSVGARVRRWWYGVNNWPIPQRSAKKEKWF